MRNSTQRRRMDRFDEAFERAHGITANGIRLDEPDYSMLTVDEESFLELHDVYRAWPCLV